MLQFAAVIALAALAIAIPQSPATPSGGGNIFNVTVGPPGPLPVFSPANITGVANGDTIVFHFVGSIQHSVTQSTFSDPCTQAQNGFNSGLLGDDNQFSLTITNASQPIWYYCQQTDPGNHCVFGMVGSINAPTDPNGNTFDKFLAAASALSGNPPAQTPTSVLSASVATGTIQPASGTGTGSNPSGASPSSTGGSNNGGDNNSDDSGAAGMMKLSMTGLTVCLAVVFAAFTL